MIRATLVQLPEDYSSLLVAKYIEGDTMQQIAQVENSTTAAVNSKLARARQAFRQSFEQLAAGSLDPA